PEGKSILTLYERIADGAGAQRHTPPRVDTGVPDGARFVEFTAQTRMSGIDLPDGRQVRKGAAAAVLRHVQVQHGRLPDQVQQQVDAVSSKGATPLLVADGSRLVDRKSTRLNSSHLV